MALWNGLGLDSDRCIRVIPRQVQTRQVSTTSPSGVNLWTEGTPATSCGEQSLQTRQVSTTSPSGVNPWTEGTAAISCGEQSLQTRQVSSELPGELYFRCRSCIEDTGTRQCGEQSLLTKRAV